MNKILLLLILSLSLCAHARQYKYYLDPKNAENILAGVALKGRISQSEWLQIIQNNKNATYRVKPGDNLWNISRRLFGDAWLWRKMWQVNQAILNPHELDSGRVLAYYNDSADYAPEWRIPVIKLTPDKQGNANDIDNDKFVNVDLKQRHRVSTFIMGDEEILGEVSGSYTPKYYMGLENELYLDFLDKANVRVGETYVIAREEKLLRDLGDASAPIVGKLMRTVGEVKVILMGEKLVRAEIVGLFHALKRGDKIVNMDKVVSWVPAIRPPGDMTARIVYGENGDRRMYGTGNLVLLNRGKEEGMKPGFLFRVYRDTDPALKSQTVVEPHYKGEIQVVYAGKTSSLGYITRSTDAIHLGDTVVPQQSFEDPAPPEFHPNDTVEIN